MASNLAQRIGFAAVAIPLAVGLVYLGGLPLTALVAAVAVLGTRELYDLAARQGILPFRAVGYASAAAVPVLVYLTHAFPAAAVELATGWPYLGAVWVMALLGWALAFRAPPERPLAAVAVTAFGVLYAGALPAFLLVIRLSAAGQAPWAGTGLVFFPLVITWVCDTAAMFGGMAVGGARLAPTVSPGKTRAGGVAGLLGGILIAPLYVALALAPAGLALPLWQALLFAAVLSVVGQVGDLAESLLKREAGVKDSSALIPGHGGVLDRFDSLYFVLPVAAGLYRLFGVI